MVRILQTNDKNDIFTTPGGRLAIVTDLQAVIQQAEHAIAAQQGEMIYALTRGTDIERNLFSGSPNALSFESFARAALDRIPQITNVDSFDIELNGSTLSYTATITTVYGTGTLSG